ncbi:MAG: 50S ribosomal protein L18 [candidate division Zixibacteria bacterium]|nr:50S ribosomal protein L18 [candidate division Zixibacteria bacterium]
MADKNIVKFNRSQKRRRRVRRKVLGTAERPRLTVSKSLKNIYVQIIDDEKEITLAAASSVSKNVASDIKKSKKKMNKTQVAAKVGEIIAQTAKEKGIETVVFDRNRNRYHGRVKAVADAAREAGLKF